MTRVVISEPVLRWALERSGRSEAVQAKFPKLSEWLRGQSQPTLNQLETFAKATSTPLGYLFLPEPPDERLSIPIFRTRGEPMRRPSADLLETVQTMEQRQAWMRDYLIEQGNEPLDFVRSAQIAEEPESLARQIRNMEGRPRSVDDRDCGRARRPRSPLRKRRETGAGRFGALRPGGMAPVRAPPLDPGGP